MTKNSIEKSKTAARLCEPLPSATRIYGQIPRRPDHLYVKTLSEVDIDEGAAIFTEHEISCEYALDSSTFTFRATLPFNGASYPAVIYVSMGEEKEEGLNLLRLEACRDQFALFELSANEIASPYGNLRTKASEILLGKRRGPSSPGKLALYAYSVSRILDYVLTLDQTHGKRIAVAGSGPLAEAALLAVATDERFSGALLLNFGKAVPASDLFSIEYERALRVSSEQKAAVEDELIEARIFALLSLLDGRAALVCDLENDSHRGKLKSALVTHSALLTEKGEASSLIEELLRQLN
ncbi:MAG: hypothetical protein J6Q85_07920 [Clostridia bacterium]|nr:hypothetical protein [Clostridia bacterium]